MAATKTSHHTRSISLPSTYYPLEASFEDHLSRLRASQPGTSTSSSLCERLYNMKDLYDHLNSSIQSPHNQNLQNTEVEEILDGSIVLLDASSVVLEALSQMKQSIIYLESALRRGNNEGVQAYMKSRKNIIIKALSKCLVNLKKVEKKSASESSQITVTALKEAEAISFSTLKSLLSYMMGKKAVSQTRGWSMVAKLVKSTAAVDSESDTEVEIIDRSLCSGSETKVVLKQLEALETKIHELEDGLESVSRCFVKTRVSLLNVINY